MSDLPSEVPIFALGTVLFPGGVLPLRIFEPRYLDMIKRCMANGTPFGVCSIKQGREVGQAAGIRDYGTLAHITDFDLLEDGLLGIEARGGKRFEVISSEVRDDQLIHAQIGPFQREEPADIPEELHHLGAITKALLEHVNNDAALVDAQFEDATWIGFRLAESLPIALEHRQSLLELNDPHQRLYDIAAMVSELMDRNPE